MKRKIRNRLIARHLNSAEWVGNHQIPAARSLKRIGLVIDMLYDDEADDASTALADIVTDLAHEAERRGVNIQDVFSSGLWMYKQEREEWSQ